MMEPMDTPCLDATTSSPSSHQNEDVIDSTEHSTQYLSLLSHPQDVCETVKELSHETDDDEDDDDDSSQAALELNNSDDDSITSDFGLSVLGDASSKITNPTFFSQGTATTTPSDDSRLGVAVRERADSFSQWRILWSRSSHSFSSCSAFDVLDGVWDDGTSETIGNGPPQQLHEQAELKSSEQAKGSLDEQRGDNNEHERGLLDSTSSDYIKIDFVVTNLQEKLASLNSTPHADSCHRLSSSYHQPRNFFPYTEHDNRSSRLECNSTASTVCDHSIALTSHQGGDDDDWGTFDDASFYSLSPRSRRARRSQGFVTVRSPRLSAFGSGGGIPSSRVKADPNDLYCNRRNVVARQSWW